MHLTLYITLMYVPLQRSIYEGIAEVDALLLFSPKFPFNYNYCHWSISTITLTWVLRFGIKGKLFCDFVISSKKRSTPLSQSITL